MDKEFFQKQMERLVDTFGVNQYKPERVSLIWKEVLSFSEEWFSKAIDHFIGNLRQAPLMPEFRAEIATERERLWIIEKAQRRKESELEVESTYSAEKVRSYCKQIMSRIQEIDQE